MKQKPKFSQPMVILCTFISQLQVLVTDLPTQLIAIPAFCGLFADDIALQGSFQTAVEE